jgi:glycogen debranching enzyme
LRDRRRWLNSRPLPAGLSRAARRTLLKALSVMKTQVYRPAGRIRHRWTTPDRWPHRKMWLWDSAFHAIGWRHVDPQIAREAIAAVLDTQARDGFVAHMMEPESVSDVTQPPVLALAAKLVQEVAPDPAWIEELYPKLGAYIEWDLANRDRDGSGLVAWKISRDPHCRCDESGMDNSPRFDAATRLAAVDFNSYLALECEILAEFAAQLGRPAEAAAWQARQERLCRLIAERLWSEELRFFTDYDLERRVLSDVRASSGFLPLICGAATAAQAECLAEHLRDPAQFGTPFPVPSIAASDTAHYAKDMWRGPVWINLNWLIARGFARYGYRELAAGLLAQTAREIEDACEKFGVLFEFYDDRKEVAPPALLRKGRCAPTQSPYHQVFHDYGWTATLYADIRYQSNSL